ncbi:MAG: enoyl-CoA hydratase/isomerase family protein [Acidimicrobiia bacterium]
MELDEITYEAADGVAVVSLDRPDVLNAISGRAGGTRDQLLHAIGLAATDDDIGCVVLRGNGTAFCGGGDLTGNTRRETLEEHRAFLEDAGRFHEQVAASAVPTIAAVHGYCLGAGVLLAAACDVVIAADNARFGFPEGRMGLVGASVLTPRIGRQWAKFLMMTGELISARQARELGIVLTVEPDDELLDRVMDLAARISRMPRESVELNRRAVDAVAAAAGEAAARAVAIVHDAETLAAADRATAPDGRTFRSIIDTEGIAGLKRARAAQYEEPWLRPRG